MDVIELLRVCIEKFQNKEFTVPSEFCMLRYFVLKRKRNRPKLLMLVY